MSDEQGWLVEVWDDDKGIRFFKGPCDVGVSMELLITGDKLRALEIPADEKIHNCFFPKEGLDGEKNNLMWWTIFDVKNMRILVKRLQAMLDTEENTDAKSHSV